MFLSDEQMHIGSGINGWTDIEMPVGKQSLPRWVCGAHVDWMNGACNSPDVTLKIRGSACGWTDQRWHREGEMYIARHEDGRAEVHYHKGAVSIVELKDERLIGTMPHKDLPTIKVRATTQQDGYAGRHIWLTMDDGEPLVLRGPWHGGAPSGYVEVYTVDMDYSGNKNPDRWNRARRWFKRSKTYGLYITEDLFFRIVARYCPHVCIARVNHSYGSRVDVYRAEWGMPKEFIYHLELGRAQRNEPAGEFWRVYWDGHERYCGSMRIPKFGFQTGIYDLPTAADHAMAARKPW